MRGNREVLEARSSGILDAAREDAMRDAARSAALPERTRKDREQSGRLIDSMKHENGTWKMERGQEGY